MHRSRKVRVGEWSKWERWFMHPVEAFLLKNEGNIRVIET
jgi:hypothetical protein